MVPNREWFCPLPWGHLAKYKSHVIVTTSICWLESKVLQNVHNVQNILFNSGWANQNADRARSERSWPWGFWTCITSHFYSIWSRMLPIVHQNSYLWSLPFGTSCSKHTHPPSLCVSAESWPPHWQWHFSSWFYSSICSHEHGAFLGSWGNCPTCLWRRGKETSPSWYDGKECDSLRKYFIFTLPEICHLTLGNSLA